MCPERPRGVNILGSAYLILGLLGILAVIINYNLLGSERVAIFFQFSFSLLLYPNTTLPIEFANYLMFNSFNVLINFLQFSDYLFLVIVSLFIGSGLYIITSFGLLLIKKWGYNLALILGSLTIIYGILLIIGSIIIIGGLNILHIVVSFIPIIFGVWLLRYQLNEVRPESEYFY